MDIVQDQSPEPRQKAQLRVRAMGIAFWKEAPPAIMNRPLLRLLWWTGVLLISAVTWLGFLCAAMFCLLFTYGIVSVLVLKTLPGLYIVSVAFFVLAGIAMCLVPLITFGYRIRRYRLLDLDLLAMCIGALIATLTILAAAYTAPDWPWG